MKVIKQSAYKLMEWKNRLGLTSCPVRPKLTGFEGVNPT